MDDLAGLDWSATPNGNASNKPTNPIPPSYSYPSLRPTPSPAASGRSTPANIPFNKPPTPQVRSSTPANDTFANLLGPRPGQTSNNLTLLERQQQIQQEKAKQEAEYQKNFEAQFGSQSTQQNVLAGQKNGFMPPPSSNAPLQPASGRSTPSLSHTMNKPFAAINGRGQQPGQKSFEEMVAGSQAKSPPASQEAPAASKDAYAFDDDDDPFGLGQMSHSRLSGSTQPPAAVAGDEDDFMGMLGRPAEEVVKSRAPEAPARRDAPSAAEGDNESLGPQNKAVAELVDMGFPADKSAIALAQTESGMNVQAAVGILLNQAHDEAKTKAQGRRREGAPSEERTSRQTRETQGDESIPAWMRREQQDRDRSGSRPREDKTAGGEKDVAQMAQEIGSSLFKSANSLWKTGQKKVQKAVAEFQAEGAGGSGGDPSQPKWMRDAQAQSSRSDSKSRPARSEATNEASMLESGARPSQQKPTERSRPSEPAFADALPERPRRAPAAAPVAPSTSSRGYRFEDNDEDLMASSSRRRRGTPSQSTPVATPPSQQQRQPPPPQSRNHFATSSPPIQSAPRPDPKPTAPKPTPRPTRQIPSIDPSVLTQSARHRKTGTDAYKRGDFGAAHLSYSSALRGIPTTHPITIIILCNRSLTALKTGDAKAAVQDADDALTVIGSSKGEGEKISVQDGTGMTEIKEMKEFFGKALMRKAEALESLERWSDALAAWKDAVQAGLGGSVAIQGRNRCEKAVSGGSTNANTSSAPPKKKPAPRSRPPPSTAPANAGENSTAVAALRAQHASQAAEEDEKFALTDTVDLKIKTWQGSKKDNLRALLASLDTVLWPEAGWAKVSMGDLVMPNRVKIIYMKAIARVHPDKISQNATTEQRMLAAAVFATLNEAWDGFKKENGL